jgi:hypothetical protein
MLHVVGDQSRQFFSFESRRILTNVKIQDNWKLDLKVSEFRGRVIKRVLLSAVSPFPLIKPRVGPGMVYRVV